ncbi:hypothetical protein AVEN_255162-1 [Araneus ventricosus]|uniref:HTH CENPB-type domain-containing protein n=1 Tax=Araneus ventricosus TaxID=182803 RepID=A0A4Y2B9H0_ARAVE|nr:hypothetical protein AVEN_255162-1 [Araneus ventricosus]
MASSYKRPHLQKVNSERKLADIFGCGKTQINKILKDKSRICKDRENFKFRGVKRMQMDKFPEIKEALIEWFKSALSKNIPISGALIKQKAMEIADALEAKDFCASNGWLDKFRVQNNILFRALYGEAAENLCEGWTTRLPLLLA